MLAVCAALLAAGYLYFHFDDEIRRHVEKILADHYTHLDVHVDSARVVKGQGIEIRGVKLSEQRTDRAVEPLITIDEIFLACDTDVEQLLSGKLQVEEMIVRRVRVHATRGADGRWDIDTLLPPPKLSDRSPPVKILDATVVFTIANRDRDQNQNIVLRDIDLALKPKAKALNEAAKTRSGGATSRPPLEVTGALASGFANSVTFAGTIEPDTGRYDLAGKVTGLKLQPELLANLPALSPEPLANRPPPSSQEPIAAGSSASSSVSTTQAFSALKTFQGQADLTFQVSHDPAVSEKVQYTIDGRISQGRLADVRLPHPVTDLAAHVRLTNDSLIINELHAMCGVTTLTLSGQKNGFGPGDPLVLTCGVKQLTLTRELFEGFGEPMQSVWRKFQPTGQVSLEQATLRFVDGHWRPDALIRCHDLSLLCDKFPYRVTGATGTIQQVNNQLTIELVAQAEDRPITIRGQWSNPGPTAIGWVTIEGKNLSVTERMIAALKPHGKAYEVVQSLHPGGAIDVFWRGWRDDPNRSKLHSHLTLDIHNGAVNYDHFTYPIVKIEGQAEANDGQWTFTNLKGVNDTGVIQCQGGLWPIDENTKRLVLDFRGDNVPLDKELHDALPPGAQEMWRHLRPSGHVNLTSRVIYESGKGPPDVQVRVSPIAPLTPGGDTAGVWPISFPCRLKQLEGQISYHNGHAQWEQISANHLNSRVTMKEGSAQILADGQWRLDFKGLDVDRLHTRDVELLAALPPDLRHVVQQLNPTGSFNLQGNLVLAGGPEPNSRVRSSWDVALQTFKSDVDCGVEFKNVCGAVRLVGNYDGRRVRSFGELDLDSLFWLDTQFTQVRGPFYVDDDMVYLGARVARYAGQGQPPRQLTALLYGGRLGGDGTVRLANIPQYELTATLQDGDLRRLAQENMQGPTELSGKVAASVAVRGSGSSLDTLQGAGQVQITDAKIYRLPVLVSMLKILRAEAPDETAFKRSDMQFQIQGPRLNFSKLDLVGDAISLYGEGEVDFEKRANLTFYSVVGRNDVDLPLIKHVIGSVSQQFMQIRVTGDLKDPRGPTIAHQMFPLLQEALQQLQRESATGVTRPVLGAPARLLEAAGVPTRRK